MDLRDRIVGIPSPEHEAGALEEVLQRLDIGRLRTPPRALAFTLLCLAVAVCATVVWPESAERMSGFVWTLAVIPVFLLAHYRGWRGAAAVSAVAMVLMVGAVLFRSVLVDRPLVWWHFGLAAALIVPATLGAGVLSEAMRRQKMLALVLAYRDPLTGLPNRRLLREHAGRMMAAAARTGGRLGLISLDLARLREINEDLGHDAGDEALEEVGRRLENSLRGSDVAARVVGDEFAALLMQEDDPEATVVAARRIEKRLSLPVRLEGSRTVHLEPCLGVAWYPDHGGTFDELLASAESIRPSSRVDETIRVCSSDPDEAKVPDRIGLAEDLRGALDADQLEDWYQLVYRCRDGRPVGAEALVRWEHPELGRLDAGEFVPYAEKIGLVERLDRMVARRAMSRVRRWCRDGTLEWLAVNVSPVTLEHSSLSDDLAAAAEETGADPRRLVIEVSERGAIRDLDATAESLRQLRDRGFRVAIDDFGLGHSSLAYLERFSPDLVKIDMEFLRTRMETPRRESLARGIAALGEGVDVQVVAEGVEEPEQMEWLRREGRCDYVQGYHLARPEPVEEVERRLAGEAS